MGKYVAVTSEMHYVVEAENLADAMSQFNEDMEGTGRKVIKWVGPTGINFLMHDYNL